MMMTDEWLAIIEQADELVEMMLASDIAAEYRRAYQTVYTNKELVQSIQTFTTIKERYEEVQRFGKYHPDYQTVMKEIRLQKRQLDVNEHVAALRLAENDFQDMLDGVSLIVAKAVSEAVKVPVGNGLFETSCSGGCGSGGGCSCSA